MKLPSYLQILSGLLLAVLVVFVGLKSWNALAEHYRIGVAVRDRDTISVQGEGKVTATPDVALLNLGVQSDADTVRAAQTDNTKKMNAITAMLKEQGVKAEDIQTSGYSIQPRINWENGQQDIVGYTVNQNVTAKVRELDKAGDILAQAGDLGANQVGGIQFTIDDPQALQDEARQKAIDDAREKAQALAKQLGITIVKVVSFNESGQGGPVYPMADRVMTLEAGGMGGAPSPAPDIQPGSEEVMSDVQVVFEVY